MNEKEISIIDLEVHKTKDVLDNHINGELTVIWRDWDKKINEPQMIYLNSVNPGEIKGPHIHKKRTSSFFCLQGKMVIIIQEKNGEFKEIEADSKDQKLVSVPEGIPAAIINPTNQITKILVIADISWKPDDNEMMNYTYDNYDWNKWKK
tara:strand:- start:548 stop:997 length:450 start_codon:yes stop_codon:yes gene_type:complete